LLAAADNARDVQSMFGFDLDGLITTLGVGEGASTSVSAKALPVNGGGLLFGRVTLPEKQRRKFISMRPAPLSRPSARSAANEACDIPDQDPVIRRLYKVGSKLLTNRINVLMSGETGSGKEHMARAIHAAAVGARKPFVAINCAALPESLIESELFGHAGGAFTGAARDGFGGRIKQADGGTLFLDEIGDMPLSAQGRLLRVLEQRTVEPLGSTKSVPVNFRLICASNVDLTRAVADGKFREDLLYRIKGARLSLPALRERSDLPDLIARLLRGISGDMAGKSRCSDDVLELLARHDWPGNIRELANVLQYACVFADGGLILRDHLPDEFHETVTRDPGHAGSILKRAEADALRQVLDDHRWHISKTAKVLGISRNTLYRKMDRFSIRRD
jgi:transcriptional regulator of acetoin/glycerol metabolism